VFDSKIDREGQYYILASHPFHFVYERHESGRW